MKTKLIVTVVTLLTVGWAMTGLADPLDGQILKFQQLPMDGTLILDVPYFGHDELSTAVSVYGALPGGGTGIVGWQGQFMADDFADKFTTPVVHVRWWGSYIHNEIIQPVDKFLIAFESDVPAPAGTPEGFSHPGSLLLSQIVHKVAAGPTPPGTYTETLKSPGGPPLGESLYEYNAELHLDKHFPQQPDTVYWLKIVALVDVPQDFTGPITQWGWHNRDYTIMDPLASTPPGVVPGEFMDGVLPDGQTIWHFQDDAVSGAVAVIINADTPDMPFVNQTGYAPQNYINLVDGPGPTTAPPPFEGIGAHSKDLAFELYTVPEPATLALLAFGAAGALSMRRPRN